MHDLFQRATHAKINYPPARPLVLRLDIDSKERIATEHVAENIMKLLTNEIEDLIR